MQSGHEKDLQKRYEDYHSDDDCKGKWKLVSGTEIPYRVDEGIMVLLKNPPLVKCDTCGASYFPEGFELAFQKFLARKMVLTTKPLSNYQIKFLRTFVGYTQADLAEALSLSSKSEISRFESPNSDRRMEGSLQVQFKVLIASKLGIAIPPEVNLWKADKLQALQSSQQVIDALEVEREVRVG